MLVQHKELLTDFVLVTLNLWVVTGEKSTEVMSNSDC
jgi:hypothetical protein